MIKDTTRTYQRLEVKEPRWRDRRVLLAEYKLGAHNIVSFTHAPTLAGEWYISGGDARLHTTYNMRTRSGSTIAMREVPLDALEPLEVEK